MLCRSPHIRMYQVELVPGLITLVGEWKLVLLPNLVGFTKLGLLTTKLRPTKYYLFRLQILDPLVVDVVDLFKPQVDI